MFYSNKQVSSYVMSSAKSLLHRLAKRRGEKYAVKILYSNLIRSKTTRHQMVLPELIYPSWDSYTYYALTRMVYKLKTDTILNNETSEIVRDLYAFRSRLLSNSSSTTLNYILIIF